MERMIDGKTEGFPVGIESVVKREGLKELMKEKRKMNLRDPLRQASWNSLWPIRME